MAIWAGLAWFRQIWVCAELGNAVFGMPAGVALGLIWDEGGQIPRGRGGSTARNGESVAPCRRRKTLRGWCGVRRDDGWISARRGRIPGRGYIFPSRPLLPDLYTLPNCECKDKCYFTDPLRFSWEDRCDYIGENQRLARTTCDLLRRVGYHLRDIKALSVSAMDMRRLHHMAGGRARASGTSGGTVGHEVAADPPSVPRYRL